ncbi:MAG: hypothetical protein US69_C0002G0106 [candidate division TM6 bacterium GW2011_GWF2_38_10]|nr:MAG: hypothetical protein US69_C0002G0106 [candidate division TM6 bacterium GW2011_GWF2_38_10]
MLSKSFCIFILVNVNESVKKKGLYMMIRIFMIMVFGLCGVVNAMNVAFDDHSIDPQKYEIFTNVKKKLDHFWRTVMQPFMIQNAEGFNEIREGGYNVDKIVDRSERHRLIDDIGNKADYLYRKLYWHLVGNGCTVLKCDGSIVVFVIGGLEKYVCKLSGYENRFFHNNTHKNVIRVVSAASIKHYCEEKNIKKWVKVPNKYLYHIPEKSIDVCDDNYLVVVERINENKITSFDTFSIEQLYAFLNVISEFGLFDIGNENVVFDKSGHIVFIDTEDYAGQYTLRDIEKHILDYREVYSALSPRLCAIESFLRSDDVQSNDVALLLYKLKMRLDVLKNTKCFFVNANQETKEHVKKFIYTFRDFVNKIFFAYTGSLYFLKNK